MVRGYGVEISADCNDQYEYNDRDDLLSNPGESHRARLSKSKVSFGNSPLKFSRISRLAVRHKRPKSTCTVSLVSGQQRGHGKLISKQARNAAIINFWLLRDLDHEVVGLDILESPFTTDVGSICL